MIYARRFLGHRVQHKWLYPNENHGDVQQNKVPGDLLESLQTTLYSYVCGSSFQVDHGLSFHYGSFPSIRHNELERPDSTSPYWILFQCWCWPCATATIGQSPGMRLRVQTPHKIKYLIDSYQQIHQLKIINAGKAQRNSRIMISVCI